MILYVKHTQLKEKIKLHPEKLNKAFDFKYGHIINH